MSFRFVHLATYLAVDVYAFFSGLWAMGLGHELLYWWGVSTSIIAGLSALVTLILGTLKLVDYLRERRAKQQVA